MKNKYDIFATLFLLSLSLTGGKWSQEVCTIKREAAGPLASLTAEVRQPRRTSRNLSNTKHLNKLDSIAVSLFGNMTVEPGEIHMITKEYQNKRSKKSF